MKGETLFMKNNIPGYDNLLCSQVIEFISLLISGVAKENTSFCP